MKCSIFCILFSGAPLTEKVSEVLFVNAHDMVAERTTKRRVKGRDYDGVITTNLESISAFGTTGVAFHAQIALGNRVTTVEYLVRVGDLDRPLESYNLRLLDFGKTK